MSEFGFWMIGQGLVLVIAIFAAYVRTAVSIAELKLRCQNIEVNTRNQRIDHNTLSKQVDGISRHVAEIDGKMA